MIRKVFLISLSSILFLGLIYVLFSPVLIGISNQGIGTPFFSVPTANAITQIVTLSVGNEATVTSPGPLALSGNISGVSGGSASGSVSLGVLSASTTGFTMSVSASSSPALVGTGSYSFFDYAPVSAGVPDFSWVQPMAGSSAFGFTVAADTVNSVVQKFRYNAPGTCNISGGANNTALDCWYGFSTSPLMVINKVGSFKSTLSTETLGFKAEYRSSPNYAIPTGTYTATITVTVSPT